MSREKQINDAIALLAEAIERGELQEKYEDGSWHTAMTMLIGYDRYKYRVKREPKEFYLAPIAEDEWVKIPSPGAYRGVIKVREILEEGD